MSFYNTRNHVKELDYDYEEDYENEEFLAYDYGLDLDESNEEEVADFTRMIKKMPGIDLMDLYQESHEFTKKAIEIVEGEMNRRKIR